MSKGRFALLVAAIFLVGAFLRLYNLPDRLIFGPEQGMSLMTSAANLKQFSLLGETNWQRATSDSHIPFHGAYYSYFLLPFIVFLNYRVLPITLVFVFLNLLTGYVLFRVTDKIFGRIMAALTLFYFIFSAIMIHHSLFSWILNPLPLLGVLTLWYLSEIIKRRENLRPALWLGVLSGVGFGLQNMYLFFCFLLFFIIIFISSKPIKAAGMFIAGAVIGNLPMVIFDLRHDFYHVRTMWQYFLDVTSGSVSGFTDYYHFLYLFPFFFLFYAVISMILYRIYKPLVFIPILVFLYFNLTSPMVNLTSSTGMPPGITLSTLENASAVIAADEPPERFNVATLWDFDTRAHPLRYLLTYYYYKTPVAVEVYKDVDALYVFAPANYDLENPRVWELQTFLPYKIINLPFNTPGYRLVKLIK